MSERAEPGRERSGSGSEPPGAGGEPRANGTGAPPRRRPAAERDADVRAALVPLAPGERPGAVTVAAVLALLAAGVNAVAYASGLPIAGQRPALVAVAAPVLLLLLVGIGLWRARYWAVLVTQVMLVLLVGLFATLGVFAENLRSAGVALAVAVPAGVLFWFLVKAMARIQMREA